jgi:hypothetical protein
MTIPPYKFRIMGCLPGDTPIEIHRSDVKYSQSLWNRHTRGFAAEWTLWSEHPMEDRLCISPRIRPAKYVAPVPTHGCRMPLTREEMAKAPGYIGEYAFNQ